MKKRVPSFPSGLFKAARTLPSLMGSEDWVPEVKTGDQQVLGVVMNLRVPLIDTYTLVCWWWLTSSLGLRGLPPAPYRKALHLCIFPSLHAVLTPEYL